MSLFRYFCASDTAAQGLGVPAKPDHGTKSKDQRNSPHGTSFPGNVI